MGGRHLISKNPNINEKGEEIVQEDACLCLTYPYNKEKINAFEKQVICNIFEMDFDFFDKIEETIFQRTNQIIEDLKNEDSDLED